MDVILGVRDKCEQSGIFHYISKPFNPDHFIQTIKDIIVENEPNKERNTAVLDRQLGLKNMGDNEDLYNQVLIAYRNENQDTLDKLEAAVLKKDTPKLHKSYIMLRAVPELSVLNHCRM